MATSPADKMDAVIQHPLTSRSPQWHFSTMSRRMNFIRRDFASIMRGQGPVDNPAPSATMVVNPHDETGPSYSSFGRAETIAAKQLKIVCIYLTSYPGFASEGLKTPRISTRSVGGLQSSSKNIEQLPLPRNIN